MARVDFKPVSTQGTALDAEHSGAPMDPRYARYQPYPPMGQALNDNYRYPAFDAGVVGPYTGLRMPPSRPASTGQYGGPPRDMQGRFSEVQYSDARSAGILSEIRAPTQAANSSVMGWRSMQFIMASEVIAPASSPYEHTLSTMDLTLRRQGTGQGLLSRGEEPTMFTHGRQTTADDRFAFITNLPVVNYMLACDALADQPEMSAADVLSAWSVAGVCVDVAGVQSNDHTALVMMTNQRAGPRRTWNIWGNDIDQGNALWLIVRPVSEELPDAYVLDPLAQTMDRPYAEDPRSGTRRALRRRAMQFLPWASRTGTQAPTKSQLEYIDEDGVTKRYGAAVRIGTVQFKERPVEQNAFLTAHYNVNSMKRCAAISVLIDQPRVMIVDGGAVVQKTTGAHRADWF